MSGTTNTTPLMSRRGIRATRYIFTPEQEQHLISFVPAFEDEVRRVDPHFQGNSRELSDWKRETAKSIMSHALFQELPDSNSRSSWDLAIRQRFTNHYNNNMAKKQKKRMNESTTTTYPLPNEKRLTNILHRALVIFTSEFPARELFASENEAEIQVAMEDIQKEQPDLLGGALRNKALGRLWGKADRAFWESQRMELQADITTNQSEFPLLMACALQDLCNRGCLGSTVMSFSYAFRDDNDGLASGTIYSGFDTTADSAISHQLHDHSENLDNWDRHADILLPRKRPAELSIRIPLGHGGIPVFPEHYGLKFG